MKTKFKTILPLIVVLALLSTMLAGCDKDTWEEIDATAQGYACAVYREQGCAKMVVASGGEFEIQSGGTLDVQDGSTIGIYDLTVNDTLNVDGDIDLDGDGFDVNITGGASIDADLASNFSAAAGDITIDAETGSLNLIGSEADASAIHLDANDTVTSGINIDTGTVSGMAIDGGPFSVDGTGTFNINTASGDITVEAETGSVTVKGDEGAGDAIHLDADQTALGGVTIAANTGGVDVNLTADGPFAIDGDLFVVGNAGADGSVAVGDNDALVVGVLEVDGELELDGTLDADSTSNFAGTATFSKGSGDAIDISSGGALNNDGTLDQNGTSDFGAAITCSYAGNCLTSGTTADIEWLGFASFGDATPDGVTDGAAEAVFIEGGLEVNGTFYADGAIDADAGADIAGVTLAADMTGAVTLAADLASNFNTSAGDLTLEAETGSVVIKGDEEVADAIHLDANETITQGIDIDVGSVHGLAIDGGLTDFGSGTYATADGADDVGIDGDLEVNGSADIDTDLDVDGTTNLDVVDIDGAVDMASTLDVAGAVGLASDVTLATDATGGNAGAKTEFIGLPRIKLVALSTMANGTTNTVITDIGDSQTPATDWTQVDADTTMSNDATYYREGTASLKMAVLTTADEDDGCTNTLASGDQDWSDDEGFGFWLYCDSTLASGDLQLVLSDSVAADVKFDVPAYGTANVWQWTEIDIATANTNKDVLEDISITLTANGETKAAGGAFNVYFDFICKWDVADEETLGEAIPYDGVLSLVMADVTSGGSSNANLVEYTDYFVHYQTGDDAIVIISDQSDADKLGTALIAY